MNTTIPAPKSETPSFLSNPYEALLHSSVLRFRDAARLAFLVLATAMLAVACNGYEVVETPEPVALSCQTVSAEAGGLGCPGSNPITVTCDGDITKRADLTPFVGSVANADCRLQTNLTACCYAPGEAPVQYCQTGRGSAPCGSVLQ